MEASVLKGLILVILFPCFAFSQPMRLVAKSEGTVAADRADGDGGAKGGESDATDEEMAEESDPETVDPGAEAEESGETELPEPLLGELAHEIGAITAEYQYNGEVYSKARGGISPRNATRYRGNFDLALSLDTEVAKWWDGGTIFAYLHQSHGRTLTQEFVGDGQYYSSIDTGLDGDVTRLGELWYEHSTGDELLKVRVGRQDANSEFAFADLGGDFLNSSFITLPNVALPTWPFQTVGVSSVCQATNELRFGGGIYDHGRDSQQWWMTATNRGVFLIGQIDYEPFADIAELPLMIFRLGAWYTSSNTVGMDGLSEYPGNYGFYTTVDRMLIPESESSDEGLATFFQASWAPDDRNQVDWHYGAGIVSRGLVPGRDADTFGCGYTTIDFGASLGSVTGQTNETAVEVFYRARLRRFLAVQPDLQYIARPNGQERDALVCGLRFDATF